MKPLVILSTGNIGELPSGSDLTSPNLIFEIAFGVDGGGSTIINGAYKYYEVPTACTIQGHTLLADQSGSIILDIQKTSYSSFPSSFTSIVASAPPTISSAQKAQDNTLTGWTVTLNAGDILKILVNSDPTNITKLFLYLRAVLI